MKTRTGDFTLQVSGVSGICPAGEAWALCAGISVARTLPFAFFYQESRGSFAVSTAPTPMLWTK